MAINYIKQFADGSTVATDVAPAYGMYTATKANDDRDVYKNGLWYPASNGGDLITNGTFDTDTSGWTASARSGATASNLSIVGGKLRITNTSSTFGSAYQAITTVIGEAYKITWDWYAGTVTSFGRVLVGTAPNTGDVLEVAEIGEVEFVATSTTTYIEMWNNNNNGGYSDYDNISVFAVEPTLGEPYTEQFTYASKEGKLLGVEVANGQPVDLHYNEYAPTLVEDTIQATNIISDNFVGKNACTAWVNFDATQTPPLIRDSFNVSDVVRTTTGIYNIYFEDNLKDTNYIATGTVHTVAGQNEQNSVSNDVKRVNYFTIFTSRDTGGTPTPYNYSQNNILVFGGK